MTQWATWAIRNLACGLLVVGFAASYATADDDEAKAPGEGGAAKAPAESGENEGHKEAGHKEAGHKEAGHKEGDGSKAEAGHVVGGHGGSDADHEEDHGNLHDLSHSNALPSQEKPEEWKFDLAIYTLVVFVLLLGILLKFAWGPIMAALAEREERVASMIDEAEQSAAKAKALLADYESKLSEAHGEAEQIVTRSKQSAQEQADKILAEAKDATEREKTRAIAEIEQAKNEALGEVTQKSVDIALGLAKSVVGREINADDHDSLIKEALAKFPS